MYLLVQMNLGIQYSTVQLYSSSVFDHFYIYHLREIAYLFVSAYSDVFKDSQ